MTRALLDAHSIAHVMKSLAEHLGVANPVTNEQPTTHHYKAQSAQAFALGVLTSPEYRDSLMRRIITDELPPQVESWLLNTAYGKPIDRLEVNDRSNNIEDLTFEQLEERAMFLADLARKLRSSDTTPPSDDAVPQSRLTH